MPVRTLYDNTLATRLWEEIDWFADQSILRTHRRAAVQKRTLDAFVTAIQPLAFATVETNEQDRDDLVNAALVIIIQKPASIGKWMRKKSPLDKFLSLLFKNAVKERRTTLAKERQILPPSMTIIDRPLAELVAYGHPKNNLPFSIRDVRSAFSTFIEERFPFESDRAKLRPLVNHLVYGTTKQQNKRLPSVALIFLRSFVSRLLSTEEKA